MSFMVAPHMAHLRHYQFVAQIKYQIFGIEFWNNCAFDIGQYVKRYMR